MMTGAQKSNLNVSGSVKDIEMSNDRQLSNGLINVTSRVHGFSLAFGIIVLVMILGLGVRCGHNLWILRPAKAVKREHKKQLYLRVDKIEELLKAKGLFA